MEKIQAQLPIPKDSIRLKVKSDAERIGILTFGSGLIEESIEREDRNKSEIWSFGNTAENRT